MLDGTYDHLDICVRTDEDDRQAARKLPEIVLKLKATQTRHAHVENGAPGHVRIVVFNEVFRVVRILILTTLRLNEKAVGVAHARIIIDNANDTEGAFLFMTDLTSRKWIERVVGRW